MVAAIRSEGDEHTHFFDQSLSIVEDPRRRGNVLENMGGKEAVKLTSKTISSSLHVINCVNS